MHHDTVRQLSPACRLPCAFTTTMSWIQTDATIGPYMCVALSWSLGWRPSLFVCVLFGQCGLKSCPHTTQSDLSRENAGHEYSARGLERCIHVLHFLYSNYWMVDGLPFRVQVNNNSGSFASGLHFQTHNRISLIIRQNWIEVDVII